MAEWKKVIVSGSDANLASLQVDNLVTGVVTGSADGTLGIQAINGTGDIVATTGASGVEISGSFSGSFQGDGSALTNISSTSIVGLTQIATGSVTASVNVETNAFTVASESIQLFNVRANGGVEHGNAVTASGAWSHAEGGSGGTITTLQAIGDYSHAEGYDTRAIGNYSHAEGELTVANAEGAHAEGYSTLADGDFSHTEGYFTTASGDYSHAEGNGTIASGNYSHAEGAYTTASGLNSHAEGDSTTASGENSHAEGGSTLASGNNSHAEGDGTISSGNGSHAEGYQTTASGNNSHAEGASTIASDYASHAEGDTTTAFGAYSHAEGRLNKTGGNNGYYATYNNSVVTLSGSYGNTSATYGTGELLYINDYAYSDNFSTAVFTIVSSSFNGTQTVIFTDGTDSGTYTVIVGNITIGPASWTGDQTYGAPWSHAEGRDTITLGRSSHTEGYATIASGWYSHAEGSITTAAGVSSHAEGVDTQALGETSHAEGEATTAIGLASHAEGYQTTASGSYSHAEGSNTYARGTYSHAEGVNTVAVSEGSHTEGTGTTAGWRGFNITSISAGLITISDNVDYSSEFYSGKIILGDYTIYTYNTTNYSAPNFTIQLDDTSVNAGTIVADLAVLNSPLAYSSPIAGPYSHAEGQNTKALGYNSHAEGDGTLAAQSGAHAEGYNTQALAQYSHAEGDQTIASGSYSHAEGRLTQAIGQHSHTEGTRTTALGGYAHAEGSRTTAEGWFSHAEGNRTIAIGTGAHSEGYRTTASGDWSHAEGLETTAYGDYSHTIGIGTIASGSVGQLAAGRYNTHNNLDSLLIIGNGTDDTNRSDLALFNSQSIVFNQPVTGSIFSGSFSGSFFGTTNLPDLTEGTGIEAFTYDGGATATVAVSGAASLSSDTITKWTGTAFADTSITDDGTLITFGNDAVFNGDIIVQGTASFQNTENLLVADRFVLFASGSSTAGDGGIIVQQGTQNVGELFGYENSADRWGFTSSFDAASTSYTPSAFVAAVVDVDGGQLDIAQYQKNGNIKIDGGDIWIYS